MEFSKPEIFVGEQVLCSFNVYTPNEIVEVEVAKFPEFRGFWNENLLLRQGPLATLFGLSAKANSATVGTYVLIPMLGQSQPTIEPMKIVLRTPLSRRVEGSQPPEFILSEAAPLKIKPLPPLPADLNPRQFIGAVGKFQVIPQVATIPFQPGEPTTLSYTLAGQGNFQEINELPIAFPPSVEIVSSRAFLSGGAQSASKTFDYNVTLKEAQPLTLAESTLIYFDPELKKYETLRLPEVRFTPTSPVAALGAAALEAVPAFSLSENWHSRSPLPGKILFFGLHGFCLGLALWGIQRRQRRARPALTVSADHRALVEGFERMQGLYQEADAKGYLVAAEGYVFEWIAYRWKQEQEAHRGEEGWEGRGEIRAAVSRPKLLSGAKGLLSSEQISIAEALSARVTTLLYQPGVGVPADLSQYLQYLAQAIPAQFPPPSTPSRKLTFQVISVR